MGKCLIEQVTLYTTHWFKEIWPMIGWSHQLGQKFVVAILQLVAIRNELVHPGKHPKHRLEDASLATLR